MYSLMLLPVSIKNIVYPEINSRPSFTHSQAVPNLYFTFFLLSSVDDFWRILVTNHCYQQLSHILKNIIFVLGRRKKLRGSYQLKGE